MRTPGLHVPCLLMLTMGSLSGFDGESRVGADAESLSVPEPSPSEPVKAVMAFRPASVTAGGAGELLVAVRVAPAHYLHATRDPGGKFTPLGIELSLPTGITALKDWEFP